MNARKHRKTKQAKETDRLEPKGTQSVRALLRSPTRTGTTAGVQSGPKSSCELKRNTETLLTSSGPRSRTDLTARRVRRHSIGRTEEANASGNALDRPTSVWSILARELAEPL